MTEGGKPAHDDWVDLLAAQEFFAPVQRDLLAQIARRMRLQSVEAGELIFSKGSEGDSLLAVVEGLVRISSVSKDGREVVLNLIGARQIFGEISLLDGLPRTANATAIARTRLLVLGRSDFRRLLLQQPILAVKLLEIVGPRLRQTSRQVETLSFLGPTARLAETLLRLAEASCRPGSGERWHVPLTQGEIGHAAGLSRETTNKKLRAWAEEGLVELRSGTCVIRRPELLRRVGAEASDD